MGTNFYFRKQIGHQCEHCGRADKYEELHVGKSSHGWKFAFDTWHGEFKSFKAWKTLMETNPGKIFDEYGDCISLTDFIEKVESKQGGKGLKEYYAGLTRKFSRGDLGEADKEFYDAEGYNFRTYSDFC